MHRAELLHSVTHKPRLVWQPLKEHWLPQPGPMIPQRHLPFRETQTLVPLEVVHSTLPGDSGGHSWGTETTGIAAP